MDPLQANKIHCIGIGGIGVSAIAHILAFLGKQITGSDLTSSIITDQLIQQSIQIRIGKHQSNNMKKGTDLVVYSNAITQDNPELVFAKKK